jgi:hypothetical protein
MLLWSSSICRPPLLLDPCPAPGRCNSSCPSYQFFAALAGCKPGAIFSALATVLMCKQIQHTTSIPTSVLMLLYAEDMHNQVETEHGNYPQLSNKLVSMIDDDFTLMPHRSVKRWWCMYSRLDNCLMKSLSWYVQKPMSPISNSATSSGENLLIRPPREKTHLHRIIYTWYVQLVTLVSMKVQTETSPGTNYVKEINQNLLQRIKCTPISYFHILEFSQLVSEQRKTETTVLVNIAWMVQILNRGVHKWKLFPD